MRWLAKLFQPRKPTPYERQMIFAEAQAISVQVDDSLQRVPFAAITKITTYKRDLGTTDMICLLLDVEGQGEWEINEEMIGYADVVRHLEAALGGFPAGWWSRVAHPAFATNEAVLYQRGADAPSWRPVVLP